MKRNLKIALLIPIGLILSAALFIVIRNALAAVAVENEWKTTTVPPLGDFSSTRTLTILPIIDEASSDPTLQAEHGVSYLIKTDTRTILFDTGFNSGNTNPSPLENNLKALNLTTADFDTIVISHPHPDHLGGSANWQKQIFSLGPDSIDLNNKKVYVPVPLNYPGLTPEVATQPTIIGEGVATLGTLPFPEVLPLSIITARNVEQILAIRVNGRGIVLITGCGHPTLFHILERAEQLFDEPIVGLVGGYHYGNATAQELAPQIERLQQYPLQLLALSPHDSESQAIEAFRAAFPQIYQDIQVGQEFNLNEP